MKVIICALWASTAIASSGGDRIADNLYGTSFVSDREGWVVGAFGTIFRTRDGGASWQPQISRTEEPLFDVDFANARAGWAVGRSGAILHTDDGGENWIAQKSGVTNHLFSVDFADAKVGCAVGDWGAIVITHDGGATWQPRPFTRDVILNGVSMPDREHVWIAGEAGVVLTSADGGETWSEQSSGVDKTLFGVRFVDGKRGWVVGIDALILATEDGGATWQIQHGSSEVSGLDQVGFRQAFDNPSLYSISVSGNQGLVVGEIGAIFRSPDGGRSWERLEVPQSWGVSWLRDVSVVPGTHGAIVGAGGRRVMITEGHIDLPSESTHAAETTH